MTVSTINFTKPETGNVFVDILLWLVGSTSIVAAIVLFTLGLKVITLPFDYASRRSMRKNSLLMEEMRPELEKLQKQYADNKQLYQQKMMALYKKNGYSMFGSCLPTILTLVIFIIALNGFSAYSRYQNKEYVYDMSVSYNSVIYDGITADGTYIIENEDGSKSVVYSELLGKTSPITIGEGENAYQIVFDITESDHTENNEKIGTKYSFDINTTNGYISYKADYVILDSGAVLTSPVIYSIIDINALTLNGKKYNEAEILGEKTYDEFKADYKVTPEQYFFREIQRARSAEMFRSENPRFIWVKNIWVSDSPFKKAVETNWESFEKLNKYEGNTNFGATEYNELINNLDTEKTQANGYFILVLLTAGISLLTQIVMNKSQKAQMELQTVDGQGAQTGKMMKWMMPIMMAIFAFMYTAAFSIYIILSSTISLGTTFLINFIVDKKYKKKKSSDDNTIRGRIHTQKEEEKKEEEKPKKKAKEDKFAHEKGGDFLSNEKSGKGHIRGRLK